MSHTRVKTTYSIEGAYGSTETVELYCHHNHSSDYVAFYNADGSAVQMMFHDWITGDNLYDAMKRLMWPWNSNVWGEGGLKYKVEFYGIPPWELPKRIQERIDWLTDNHFTISDGVVADMGKKGDYVCRLGDEIIVVSDELIRDNTTSNWLEMQRKHKKLTNKYFN